MRALFDPVFWVRGLWFPALVFLVHYSAGRFHVYALHPDIDRPLHFFGGLSVAFATSEILTGLDKKGLVAIRPGWIVLPVSVSNTALFAILWEVYEFILNRVYGVHIQTELDDTLYDLFLGVAGALAFCVFALLSRYLARALRRSTELPTP